MKVLLAKIPKFIQQFPYKLVLVTISLSGVSYFIALQGFPKKAAESVDIWHDVFRDISIAFFVAVIVTLVYEWHAKRLFHHETVAGIFATLFNDLVGMEVWKEVKEQVVGRSEFRKDAFITMELEKLEKGDLPQDMILIKLKFKYTLCALKDNVKKVDINHFLDSFMRNENLDLPRFEQLIVDDTDCLEGKKLSRFVRDGRLSVKAPLIGNYEKPIEVTLTRTELAYIPGSYSLVMGESTNNTRLHLDKMPKGISVVVYTKSKEFPLEEDKITKNLGFFLPGQVIEFRFRESAKRADQ